MLTALLVASTLLQPGVAPLVAENVFHTYLRAQLGEPIDYRLESSYAVAAGCYTFPVFDLLLKPESHASDQEIAKVFTVLSELPEGVPGIERYRPTARRAAVRCNGDYASAAFRFLARHGEASDIKLALMFLIGGNAESISGSCCDILSRFGGPEEAALLEAAIARRGGYSQIDSACVNHMRASLAKMNARLAAEKRDKP